MKREIQDVVIIGAGPAGSMTAIIAAKNGLSVLLVDRAVFPREKVCGCCFNSLAQQLISTVGLDLKSLGALPLYRMQVCMYGCDFNVPISALSLSRAKFDSALVQEARNRGVQFREGCRAELGPIINSAREVALHEGKSMQLVRAKNVVIATGLSGISSNELPAFSPLTSAVGLGAHFPLQSEPGVLKMNITKAGYAGLVSVGSKTVTAAAAVYPKYLKKFGAQSLLKELTGIPISITPKGTMPLTSHRTVSTERVFVVGDAASYIEPFTGEGIGWALLGGHLLGTLLAAANPDDPSISEKWQALYHREIRAKQRFCTAITSILRNRLASKTLALTAQTFPTTAEWFAHKINYGANP